jgi:5-methylcytosine-specific restriction enzyme subunit McrC
MTVPAASDRQPLTLTEFQERRFAPEAFSSTVAELLWREHGSRVSVEFPSPKTGGEWVLKNTGWVGLIPLGQEKLLSLQPKVPVVNLLRMLEYAYRLDAFRSSEKIVGTETVQEVFESLARVLARRVRDRSRKGLHRSYVERDELLPVVRGRIDVRRSAVRSADTRLHCHYEEHTADNEDNQILLHALDVVLRSGLCRDQARDEVRQAHHLLRGAVTPVEFAARTLLDRAYDRLNHDYRGLHALSYFFLAHTGPTHRHGRGSMTPFLVDMASLFEKFVAGWLRAHLPQDLILAEQESGSYDPAGEIGYRIDLLLYDEEGRPVAVLDTKYKRDVLPSSDDVAQVVAYATKKGCREAVLVYPWTLGEGKVFQVGEVRVRSLGFPLEGDMETAGEEFLWQLLKAANVAAPTLPSPSVGASAAGTASVAAID